MIIMLNSFVQYNSRTSLPLIYLWPGVVSFIYVNGILAETMHYAFPPTFFKQKFFLIEKKGEY